MQTNRDGEGKPTEVSTSANVRGRPPASTSRVIDRLDMAMLQVGVNGAELAHALGIKPQNLTNMRRKSGGSDGMRVGLIARAAEFLRCDLRWLCTGEGGDYVPAGGPGELSEFARDIAQWIDGLSPEKRAQFVMIAWDITRDRWPVVADEQTRPAK
jgi:hypothetical protein